MSKDEFGPHPSEVGNGRPKTSTGVKCLIGCGIGCGAFLVIAVIGCFVGYRWLMNYVDEKAAPFEARGFKRVTAWQLTITDDITEPTLFVGQMVQIKGDADAEVAIIAQMAEIHGTISGKLHFHGQILDIKPGAQLEQGLDVHAQIVNIQGKVAGEITGTYQQLPVMPPDPTLDQPPPDDPVPDEDP